jgi:hypothetical protein
MRGFLRLHQTPNLSDTMTISIRFGTAALAVLVTANSLLAQNPAEAFRRPLVMAHGIRSEKETWNVASDALRLALPVAVLRETTIWTSPVSAQATDLEQRLLLGLPDSTLAIAHSGGGLVMRQAAFDNAPMNGLLTIGSPNSGTPASIAVITGAMGQLGGRLTFDATGFYQTWTYDPYDFDHSIFEYFYWLSVANVGEQIGTAVTNLLLQVMGFNPAYQVWSDYLPDGLYQQAINSTASLAMQAQNVPARGFVQTAILDPDLALLRLSASESGAADDRAVLYVGAISAAVASIVIATEYCTYPNFSSKCISAGFMGALSYDLGTLLQQYCSLAQTLDEPYTADCQPSDGLIPFDRQQWGPDGYATPYYVPGVSHTEQTKNGAVINAMKQFVQVQGSTSPCGAGPVVYFALNSFETNLFIGSTSTVPVAQKDACGGSTSTAVPVQATSSDPSVFSVISTTDAAVTLSANSYGTATITLHAAGRTVTSIVHVIGL